GLRRGLRLRGRDRDRLRGDRDRFGRGLRGGRRRGEVRRGRDGALDRHELPGRRGRRFRNDRFCWDRLRHLGRLWLL
ncbi:hypothetical protein EF905_30910, partial [Streptomyces sp. WAC05374]